MIVSHDREKLIHAIVFFCKNTKHCHTMKLFKLLNFLDFEHYRQTGRTVTGLRYFAWPQGPVPAALWEEITQNVGSDLRQAVTISTRRDSVTHHVERRDIKPKIEVNRKIFSRRELSIMNRLSMIFDDAHGEDMSELSHMKKLPWRKVWADGTGKGREIPEELALDSEPLTSEPTIDRDELAYRKDILKGLQ